MKPILRERIGSISTYLLVVGWLWFACAIYISTVRDWWIASWYYLPSATILGIGVLERRKVLSRDLTVNLFLFANFVGLLICSSHAKFRESTIEFHFAIVCLMAIQLLGIKSAVRWFCFTVAAIFISLFTPVAIDTQLTNGNTLDHFASALLLTMTVLWISAQAERTYLKTTAQLQTLAERNKEKSQMLKLAEETASIGHWRWNVKSKTTHFSDKLKKICFLPHLKQIDDLIVRFDSPGNEQLRQALEKASREASTFSIELSFTENETERYITCRGFSELGSNGSVKSVFGVIRDETELKQATQRLTRKADELNQLAIVDTLTGLSNRHWFQIQLEKTISNALESEEQIGLIVLDMDGFKEINDTLGHAMGDLVLTETANRIQNLVSSEDVVSRLGGDEFTVIVRNAQSVKEIQQLSQQIVDAIRVPMHFENSKMQVGASIGIGLCPNHAKTADKLFTYADTAMYDAKFNSEDVSMYEPSMTEELLQRKKVESMLSEAVERDEFTLVYQPQFKFSNRSVVGVEALIRWNNDGKVISPAEFIPILENSGRIIETGQWILDQACRQLKAWEDHGIGIRMAVNISPVQFRDPEFYNRVVGTLERHSVAPHCLDLEITESAIISDVDHTVHTLQKLKDLGCMISIDDFGTGYSSLAYLKNFPIDQLKIDREFIKDIPNGDDGMIASSIVVLGLSLGMEVLAEGVETEEQLQFLQHYDCDNFQGYVSCKPVPPDECLEFMLKNSSQAEQNQIRFSR